VTAYAVDIVDTATGATVHTVTTPHAPGSSPYERMLDGMYRRVDLDRYHVVERDLEPTP